MNGELLFLRHSERLKIIENMPIVELKTGQIKSIKYLNL